MSAPTLGYPRLPKWAAVLYGILALALVPWIAYLAFNLPTRHVSRHWDISWVGLDFALALLLILNSVFSYFESDWLVITGTATTVLLCTDAWFDVMSARPGLPLAEAAAAAAFIELPLAILALSAAVRSLHRKAA